MGMRQRSVSAVPVGDRRAPALPAPRGHPAAGRPVPTHPPSGALDHMTSTQVRPSSTPQIAVNDIGTAENFLAPIDKTIKYSNDADIVKGVIARADRARVWLASGSKTAGAFPSGK